LKEIAETQQQFMDEIKMSQDQGSNQPGLQEEQTCC
jgi:hypothetical protein